jgi:hypothetical protein
MNYLEEVVGKIILKCKVSKVIPVTGHGGP